MNGLTSVKDLWKTHESVNLFQRSYWVILATFYTLTTSIYDIFKLYLRYGNHIDLYILFNAFVAAATKVLKNLPKINVFVVINHKFLDNDRASFDASYAFCVLCFIISSFFFIF